jgi:hypothetical protein
VKANHHFKAGAQIRHPRDVADIPDTYGSRGNFNFGEGPTALNGNPDTSRGSSTFDQGTTAKSGPRFVQFE